jgi:hypothetical protein
MNSFFLSGFAYASALRIAAPPCDASMLAEPPPQPRPANPSPPFSPFPPLPEEMPPPASL